VTERHFQQNPANEVYTFLYVRALSNLVIATIFASFVEDVAPVKIMNFEEYSSIATRGTARRFITVPVNFTQYVADCNHNYTVYSKFSVMVDKYSGTILKRKPPAAQCHTAVTMYMTATSSTVLHSCDVTPYKTVFFIRTSNFDFQFTDRQCTAESTVDTV